jgi:hypothetical protein
MERARLMNAWIVMKIESYARTIELDDATSYARIGSVMKKEIQFLPYNFTMKRTWRSVTWQRMDCYYWFLCASKLSKALFYVNKALAIDNQNRLYWKRYATINTWTFEEAEFGFRRRLNLGYRTRYVVVLGWYSTVSWWIWKCHSNPIASNRILSKRTKSNTVWLESILWFKIPQS